jgi:hypothetical protein
VLKRGCAEAGRPALAGLFRVGTSVAAANSAPGLCQCVVDGGNQIRDPRRSQAEHGDIGNVPARCARQPPARPTSSAHRGRGGKLRKPAEPTSPWTGHRRIAPGHLPPVAAGCDSFAPARASLCPASSQALYPSFSAVPARFVVHLPGRGRTHPGGTPTQGSQRRPLGAVRFQARRNVVRPKENSIGSGEVGK